jgi:hypothetical protein
MMKSKFADRFRAIVEGDGTWVEKLEKILKIKKEEDGLIGFHFSCFPKEGQDVSNENIAKDLCIMILASAEGRYKDVTGEVL